MRLNCFTRHGAVLGPRSAVEGLSARVVRRGREHHPSARRGQLSNGVVKCGAERSVNAGLTDMDPFPQLQSVDDVQTGEEHHDLRLHEIELEGPSGRTIRTLRRRHHDGVLDPVCRILQ